VPSPIEVAVALEATTKVDITTVVAFTTPPAPGNATRVFVSYASSWTLFVPTLAFTLDMASPVDSRLDLALPLQPGDFFWVEILPLVPASGLSPEFLGLNAQLVLHN
jgi:hypothetical protein